MLQESGRAHYQSYLLRLWQPDDLGPWQASLQDTANGEVHQFSELDSLWTFLVQAMESDAEPPPETSGS